jgi:hypothetical protein
MSNPGSVDPIASLGEGTTEDMAREHIARLVVGGLDPEQANKSLAAHGMAPLQTGTRDYHEARKEALTSNPEFRAKVLAGDPEANSRLLQLDMQITSAKPGKMTDTTAPASSPAYDAARREMGYHLPNAATYDAYDEDIVSMLADCGMPGRNAASLMEDHFAAIHEVENLTDEELEQWGDQQLKAFSDAVGGEAAIKAATEKLRAKSGRPNINLADIAKSNGARVALNLFFTAQTI